jgi:hypothetical protein
MPEPADLTPARLCMTTLLQTVDRIFHNIYYPIFGLMPRPVGHEATLSRLSLAR